MLRNPMRSAAVTLVCCAGALCQTAPLPAPGPVPEPSRTVPVYRVTVVERSLQAVNYQYRSGPTEIDFKGTVLLPNSKGHATVESKRGRTEIDAKFDKLTPPTPFGRQYLTYVLWAISPEGAPHNLGEVVANGGDSARVHVTTDLQVFGLLVTAEPYSAVRQPSDVVVLENQVRPDTIGQTQPIIAKAELLSRGQFTYDKQAGMAAAAVNTPRVSMDEYEKLLELYQAENALGIARAAHADELAPEVFSKAQASYDEARRLLDGRVGVSLVVQAARAAAQTADDARMIAVRREQEMRVANAEQQAAQAQDAVAQARADAQQARAEADAARAQVESERVARQQAESQAAQAPRSEDLPIAPPPPAAAPPPPPPAPDHQPIAYQPDSTYSRQQQQARMRMLEKMNAVVVTRDTPRGLVVTIGDAGFDSASLRSIASDTLARLAPVLMQPGVHVSVEGYSDSAAGAGMSESRAAAVRDMLISRGVASNMLSIRNLADSRPLTSNSTAAGRVENRRVEIVVSSAAIGSQPLWDRSYDVTLR
jgi:outer membrane protein OmpA-like peptidoglycan-associated protein